MVDGLVRSSSRGQWGGVSFARATGSQSIAWSIQDKTGQRSRFRFSCVLAACEVDRVGCPSPVKVHVRALPRACKEALIGFPACVLLYEVLTILATRGMIGANPCRYGRVEHDDEGGTLERRVFLQDRRRQDVDHKRDGRRPHHRRRVPGVRQNRLRKAGHQHVPRGEGENRHNIHIHVLAFVMPMVEIVFHVARKASDLPYRSEACLIADTAAGIDIVFHLPPALLPHRTVLRLALRLMNWTVSPLPSDGQAGHARVQAWPKDRGQVRHARVNDGGAGVRWRRGKSCLEHLKVREPPDPVDRSYLIFSYLLLLSTASHSLLLSCGAGRLAAVKWSSSRLTSNAT